MIYYVYARNHKEINPWELGFWEAESKEEAIVLAKENYKKMVSSWPWTGFILERADGSVEVDRKDGQLDCLLETFHATMANWYKGKVENK